jgi:putative Holliday junction resolvase
VGRILGLDDGHRRIGVAVSDPLGMIAQPLETWTRFSDQQVIARIEELIESKEIQCIVLGYPLTLKGDASKSTLRVERFRKMLTSRLDLPVEIMDERLTSVQAQRIMHEMNIKPSKNRAQVDQRAAALLLQAYMDRQTHSDIASSGAVD